MTYAQKDYPSKLGDSTIAESGSLLVAFCNLLEHFGKDVSPDDLQYELYNRGSDPSKLTWAHISQAFPEIGIYQLNNGKPDYSDSIVVLKHNGRTSYAAVADARAGTIIDSFDGEEKDWDLYGGPTMFVTYAKYDVLEVTPLSLTPPAEAEKPVEDMVEDVFDKHKFDLTREDPIDTTSGIFADDSTIIPVRRLSESADWKMTLKTGLGVIETISNQDRVIQDLAGEQPDVELKKGTVVNVAARFVKDGTPYYRTVDSTNNDHWYGIPAGVLDKTDKQNEDDLDKMLDEISMLDPEDGTTYSAREKLIKAGATAEGRILGILKRKKSEGNK